MSDYVIAGIVIFFMLLAVGLIATCGLIGDSFDVDEYDDGTD